ncbi:unnamed protein product [Callosobruchus maculatus]|uniref:C2H2-type domain-containing protein n=1 Tax=Callosobruchus maculatus TaxID=64391 RepID=A0A653DWK6_CALMS|nr:unnamed protein product [Callosobruchus maculatus]
MSEMKEADITVTDREPFKIKMNTEDDKSRETSSTPSNRVEKKLIVEDWKHELEMPEVKLEEDVDCEELKVKVEEVIIKNEIDDLNEANGEITVNSVEKKLIVEDWKHEREMPEINLKEDVDCEELKVKVEEVIIKNEIDDLNEANGEITVNRIEEELIVRDWKNELEMLDTKIKLEEDMDCEELKVEVEEVIIKDENDDLNVGNGEIALKREYLDQQFLENLPDYEYATYGKPVSLSSTNAVEGDKKYKCDMCDYKSDLKNRLHKHKLTHDIEGIHKKHKCQQCDFKTHYKSNLKIHQLTHQMGGVPKRYTCDLCDYKASKKAYLDTHKLTHVEGISKNYKCKMCDYKTHSKAYLKNHQLVHNVEKYKCEMCDYNTNWKGNLKKHQSIHDVEGIHEKYKCEMCDYKTHLKAYLKKHELKHDVVGIHKKYKCEMCDYRTHWKTNLKSHQLKHDVEGIHKKYRCEMCDYKTHFKHDLKQHQSRRHS